MLHDCTIARWRSTVPWPPSFQSLNVAVPRWNSPVHWVRSAGVSEPSWSAAAATRTLKTAAVLTAQVLVEQPLETALADHFTAPVATLPELVFVRLADVPEQVRGKAARRVHALRLDLRDYARELEPPLLHLRDILEREPAAHTDGRERVGLHARDRVLELLVGDAQQRGDAAQHRVTTRRVARQLAGNQRERERRAVVDERHTVAVEEDAARRRDRADADPVSVRGVEEAPALEHLEVPELPDNDDKRRRNGEPDAHDTSLRGVGTPDHPAAAEDTAHRRGLTTRGRAATGTTRGPSRARRPGSRCRAPAGGRRRASRRRTRPGSGRPSAARTGRGPRRP